MNGIIIGRHINGITLNPLEYVLDEDDEVMVFETEDKARDFLREYGFDDEDMEHFVFEEVFAEHEEYYTEAVEVCPHCDSENVYPMWDTEVSGFVAVCKHCGKEILLCDECQHTILEDGEVHNCDWCKTECGGKCHRGCTKD